MESEDYDFYRGLVFLLENTVNDLGYDLTFSTEVRVAIPWVYLQDKVNTNRGVLTGQGQH